jgi:hypothetical protein
LTFIAVWTTALILRSDERIVQIVWDEGSLRRVGKYHNGSASVAIATIGQGSVAGEIQARRSGSIHDAPGPVADLPSNLHSSFHEGVEEWKFMPIPFGGNIDVFSLRGAPA